MKFRSPTGAKIRITTETGHCATIRGDWRELPEILHLAALAAGCECDKERVSARKVEPVSTPEAAARPVTHDDVYRKALTTMLERNEEGDFTSAELPNINAVSKLCGMNARKEDVLRVFRAMTAEAGVSTMDATPDRQTGTVKP